MSTALSRWRGSLVSPLGKNSGLGSQDAGEGESNVRILLSLSWCSVLGEPHLVFRRQWSPKGIR